jgi:nucleotide-binding universal stress UspA family protein
MTRGFIRILVPTDFSPQSDAALATARMLAARFGSSIHLIHVIEDPYTAVAFATEVYGYMPPGVKETWQRQAQAQLDGLLTDADRAKFRPTTEVLFGSAAASIVTHANENAIDLIVMGTHGRGGVAHLLLGSVAERVVRTAGCPVMTVRGSTLEPVPVHDVVGRKAVAV